MLLTDYFPTSYEQQLYKQKFKQFEVRSSGLGYNSNTDEK